MKGRVLVTLALLIGGLGVLLMSFFLFRSLLSKTPTENSHPLVTAEPHKENPTASIDDDGIAMEVAPYEPHLQGSISPRFNSWQALKVARTIRVLITPGRSTFHLSGTKSWGFELEMLREFEKHLNKHYPGRIPWKIVFIPIPHRSLLPSLQQGLGDMAVNMLTITNERKKQVAFTKPYLKDVDEVLVRHIKAPKPQTWSDIVNEPLAVMAGSSHYEHLQGINDTLNSRGFGGIDVRVAEPPLTSEDILEMVNMGLIPYTVADSHLADLWSQVLPDMVIEPHLVTATDGEIAWAVRKDSAEFITVLNAFLRKNRKGTLIGNILFKRYYRQTKWLDHHDEKSLRKLEQYTPFFQEAGRAYNLPWRLIAMQCFQESKFDAKAKSPRGAIGLMQLLPKTAKEMGVKNIYDPRENIMGGAKYMNWLRERYSTDAGIAAKDQHFFTLAAYNAGFRRVRSWRQDAPQSGLDPNSWFGQVEIVASRQTGREPVRYVGDIVRNATAVRWYLETENRRRELRQDRDLGP